MKTENETQYENLRGQLLELALSCDVMAKQLYRSVG